MWWNARNIIQRNDKTSLRLLWQIGIIVIRCYYTIYYYKSKYNDNLIADIRWIFKAIEKL